MSWIGKGKFRVEDWLAEKSRKVFKVVIDEALELSPGERAQLVVRIARMLGVSAEDIVESKLQYKYA